jgi:hypothetical protein
MNVPPIRMRKGKTLDFLPGRRALGIYLTFILVLVALSGGLRVRTYLLTRRIYEVLAGLEKVRVDMTTEQQLANIVPYLTSTDDPRSGTRYYRVQITNNEQHWLTRVPSSLGFLLDAKGFGGQNKWGYLNPPLKVAYVLGMRHLSFSASVVVLNGIVSSTRYELEPDVLLGYPLSNFVVARSAHGFSTGRSWHLLPVRSPDDESPDFRFGPTAGEFSQLRSSDSAIAVAYSSEAPRDLVSHAYHVDLRCFWGLRGCDSVQQVVPLLWTDRQATILATEARLASPDPCPDRILAGRVRTIVNLNVAVLEVVSTRSEATKGEQEHSPEIVIDYQLKQVILGDPRGPWTGIRYPSVIPSPVSRRGYIPNVMRPPKQGDQVFYFGGADFSSCQIVPATPSALAAVRTATPPAQRTEDDISGMWGRL